MALDSNSSRAAVEDALQKANKAETALRAYTLTNNPSMINSAAVAAQRAYNALAALGYNAVLDAPAQMAAPVLTPSAQAVSVAYTAPANNGSAILDYLVSTTDGLQFVITASNSLVAATAGKSVAAYIQARNAVGYGDLSPLSAYVLPTAGTMFPVDTRMTFEGDSRSVLPAAVVYALPLDVLMGGRIYYPAGYNDAVSGERLDQMVSPTEMAAVVADQSAIISILAGVNDLTNAGGPASAAAANTLANTMFGYINTMLSTYFASSYTKLVLVFKEPPSSVLTGFMETGRLAYNALLDTISDSRVRVVSSHLTNWDYTTYDYDGLHPNWVGGYAYAMAAYQILNPLVGGGDISAGYLTDAANLLVAQSKNSALTGTTGTAGTNVTGVVATGWSATVTGTGITAVASLSTSGTGSGAAAQRFVCSGTPAAIGNELQFSVIQILTPGSAANDAYECWIDFEIAAGSTNIKAYGAVISAVAQTPSIASTGLMGPGAYAGTLRCPAYVFAGSVANIYGIFKLRFDTGLTAADVKFSRPYFRKVPAPNATQP